MANSIPFPQNYYGHPFLSPPTLPPKLPPLTPPPPPPPRKMAPPSPPPPIPRPHPPPPPITPLVPPPPQPSPNHTVIIVVFVSLGGVFFLAFLAAAMCCFLKRRKKKKLVEEVEVVNVEEHVHVNEAVVSGSHGQELVVLTVDDDIKVQEVIKKKEIVGEASGGEPPRSTDGASHAIAGI